ncbi:hypothetical protein KC850_02300 [Candidatus Kaiserbacteria bacterium]|nr:hypothetical protein [Candidatus Kaiserbacteria bacterium]MCB9818092.1 hypothetical protein [Candidatus Nomurabacteria bacterium]
MNTELITSVKERIALGHSDESIAEELKGAGYNDLDIKEVLVEAHQELKSGTLNIPKKELPGVMDLLSSGLDYVRNRYDLVLILAIPFASISLLEYLNTLTKGNLLFATLFGIGSFVAIVGYFLILVAILYIVSFSAEREVSFQEALVFARKNILSFFWLNIVSSLVIIGGYVLLIIPGIILSVYIIFSQFTFSIEGRRGVDALLRSRNLVKNNWWTIVKKISGVYVVLIIIFILVGAVAGLTLSSLPEGAESKFLFDVGAQLLGAVMSVIGLVVGVELYRHFATSNPSKDTPIILGRKKYIGLAILGFLFSLLVVGSVGYLYSINGDEYLELQNEFEVESDFSAKERALELRVESSAIEGQ